LEVAYAREFGYEGLPEAPALIQSPQTGRSIAVILTLDTGAQQTILDELIAPALGINLGAAIKGRLLGVRGIRDNIPVAPVEIVLLGDERFRVPVGAAFVPDALDNLGNLLGLDYFEHVDLGISHSKRTLYFGLPD
jgi:hypothetical protein